MIADDIRTKTKHDPTGKSGGYKFDVLPSVRDTKREDAVEELYELAKKHVGNIKLTVKGRPRIGHVASLHAKVRSDATALRKLVLEVVSHMPSGCSNYIGHVGDPRAPGSGTLMVIAVNGPASFHRLQNDVVLRAHIIIDSQPGNCIYKDRTGLL